MWIIVVLNGRQSYRNKSVLPKIVTNSIIDLELIDKFTNFEA